MIGQGLQVAVVAVHPARSEPLPGLGLQTRTHTNMCWLSAL